MLAKITTKNQITIPKKIIDQLPDVKYLENSFLSIPSPKKSIVVRIMKN